MKTPNMREMSYEFERQKGNLGKGMVTKVTDYSFVWTTNPDKNGNTKETVYYASYFVNVTTL